MQGVPEKVKTEKINVRNLLKSNPKAVAFLLLSFVLICAVTAHGISNIETKYEEKLEASLSSFHMVIESDIELALTKARLVVKSPTAQMMKSKERDSLESAYLAKMQMENFFNALNIENELCFTIYTNDTSCYYTSFLRKSQELPEFSEKTDEILSTGNTVVWREGGAPDVVDFYCELAGSTRERFYLLHAQMQLKPAAYFEAYLNVPSFVRLGIEEENNTEKSAHLINGGYLTARMDPWEMYRECAIIILFALLIAMILLLFVVMILYGAHAEVSRAREQKKGLELELMQSRINPHLLYNSLSVIEIYAKRNGDEETEEIINMLIAYYRAALGEGKSIATIADELDLAEKFVDLKRRTSDGDFTLEIDCAQDCRGYFLPHLILMPVVENAVIHGLAGRQNGEMSIRVWRNGHIYIEITDNGYGMEQEVVGHILDLNYKNKVGKGGYGLKNTIQRLKLYYGDACSIVIKSKRDEGTMFLIRLPLADKTSLQNRWES